MTAAYAEPREKGEEKFINKKIGMKEGEMHLKVKDSSEKYCWD